MNFKKNLITTALLPSMAFTLVACEESSVDAAEVVTVAEDGIKSLSLDASSHSEWTYVNLVDNKVVTDSETWQVAFQRYRVKSNDAVTAGIAEKQLDWYDAEGKAILSAFVSGTADSEANEFTKDYADTDIEVVANAFTPAIDSAWYNYDSTTHVVSANPDNKWFVLNNDGATATKVWVSAFDSATQTQTLSFQLVENDALTAEQTVELSFGQPSVAQCFDFDAAQMVDCSSDAWDYSIETDASGRGYVVRTNGGESGNGNGGAYGPLTETEAAEVSLGYISYYIAQDRTQGVFDQYVPFEYGINNDHSMYANFRTYVIETDAQRFNLRVTDYYNDAGDSGHITLQTLAK